jgi:hypothetical protein
MQYNKPYSFEKTDVRGLFYFNFFNRNVKSKHVCQLAYNTRIYAVALTPNTRSQLHKYIVSETNKKITSGQMLAK